MKVTFQVLFLYCSFPLGLVGICRTWGSSVLALWPAPVSPEQSLEELPEDWGGNDGGWDLRSVSQPG